MVVFLSTCGLLMVGYILLLDSVTSLLLLRRLKCGNNNIHILYSEPTNTYQLFHHVVHIFDLPTYLILFVSMTSYGET